MKKLLLSLALSALSICAFAQYTFSPAQTLDSAISYDQFHTIEINFSTPSPRDITYAWRALEDTIPNGWNYSLCDFGGCYAGVPDSGTMGHITMQMAQSGTKGFFTITVNADGNQGVGYIELEFYDMANPADKDTVAFTLTQMPGVGLVEVNNAAVNIFPVPAKNFFNISNTNNADLQYRLMSLTGQVLVQDLVLENETARVATTNIPSGIYLLETIQGDASSVQKLIIRH